MSNLTYDSKGFIIGTKQMEKGLSAVKDDTQAIIELLKGEQKQSNIRTRQQSRSLEKVLVAQNRQTLTAIAKGEAKTNNKSRKLSSASSPKRNYTNNAGSGNSHNKPNRGADGRFASDGTSQNSNVKWKRELIRDIASTFRGGTDTQGIDPLVDSLREAKELTAPLAKGMGLLGRVSKTGSKWSWGKFKSMKRREPLPSQQAKHNKANERYLKDIKNAVRRNGRGGLASSLLGLFSGKMGKLFTAGGLLTGLLSIMRRPNKVGDFAKGSGKKGWFGNIWDKAKNSRAGRVASRIGGGARGLLKGAGRIGGRALGWAGTLINAGVLASEWDNLDHKGKSAGVGSVIGGAGGAAAGAAIGATIGSVVPVIGTAIGGVVGAGIGGWLGSDAGEKLGETASPYIKRWTDDLTKYDLPSKMNKFWESSISGFFGSFSHIGGFAGKMVKKMNKWSGDGGGFGGGGAGGSWDYDGVNSSVRNNNWLEYQNQGAIRNKPLSSKLVKALDFVGDMGLTMKVVSGGQDEIGHGQNRTGSTRHDNGMSADVDFYKGSRKLSFRNKNDIAILSEIVSRARGNGLTGFGAQKNNEHYMGDGRMHLGYGTPAVWGASHNSDSAPVWLVEAFNNPIKAPVSNYANGSAGGSLKLSGSQKQKFMQIMTAAKNAGSSHPAVVAAQWAIESGWGKSESGKNNFFGIKAGKNQAGTYRWTREQLPSGKIIRTKAKFRDFDTIEDGLKGRISLVQNSRYWGKGYNDARTPREAVLALKAGKQGGYATDKNYNNKLFSIMRSVGIDINKSSSAIVRPPTTKPIPKNNRPSNPNHN